MDDKTIIRHYWDRNEIALKETDEKYGPFCTSIAMNILNDREDSKECVNDTYLRTWNAIPPARPAVFPAFIGRITRNLAFDRYNSRKAAKRGGGEMNAVLEELEESLPDRTVNVESDEKELAETLNEFLTSLPDKNRDIFVLRYWHAESVANIANIFDMTENSVSALLSRLRNKLHKHLTERGFEP